MVVDHWFLHLVSIRQWSGIQAMAKDVPEFSAELTEERISAGRVVPFPPSHQTQNRNMGMAWHKSKEVTVTCSRCGPFRRIGSGHMP